MPIISYQSDFVRYIGVETRTFATRVVEIKQFIQYQILGVPEFQPYLGPISYELQQMVTILNQQDFLAGDDLRLLTGLSERLAAAIGGGYSRPSWFSPGFFGGATPVYRASAYVPTLYGSRSSLFNISRVIYGGYGGGYLAGGFGGYVDPVNALAAQGTYVNVANTGVDPSVQALRDMLRGYSGPTSDLGPIL